MKRIAELDALRGIAALWVVAYHYSFPYPEIHARYFASGGHAVDLFFVLSGYLISAIILGHAGEPKFLRSFYIRRGLRIWPAYYVFILAMAAFVAWNPAVGSIRELPQYLTFTQFVEYYWFGEPTYLNYYSFITWTLAIEEQFYLLWPLLIVAVGRRAMAPMAVACILASIAARWLGFKDWILLARSDGFAIGAILAVALEGAGRSVSRAALTWGLVALGAASVGCQIALTALISGGPTDVQPVDTTVFCLGFAALVGLVVLHRGHALLAPLRARWLCFLGLISYGIYLYHMAAAGLAAVALRKLGLTDVPAAAFLASPVACLSIALASWYLLEKPFLRLKDRHVYGRPTPAPAEAVPHEPEAPADDGLLGAGYAAPLEAPEVA